MIKSLTMLGLFSIALLPFKLATLAQTAPKSSVDRVRVVESSEERKLSLQQQPDLQFGITRSSGLTVQVNDAVTYQPIEGFGASLTDSSAWLLWNKLPAAQRDETLQELFDPRKGLGLSILRQPMGASDFALDGYSYDDALDGDPSLQQFSIEKDQRYIIPILKQALALNPQLKIIASPWSPPGWMKTSHSMIRGALLPDSYRPLASYFVRFVEAYKQAGLPIYAITMQNEPVNVPVDYPVWT